MKPKPQYSTNKTLSKVSRKANIEKNKNILVNPKLCCTFESQNIEA